MKRKCYFCHKSILDNRAAPICHKCARTLLSAWKDQAFTSTEVHAATAAAIAYEATS